MKKNGKYPTFFDQILAAIPKDRWITYKELMEQLGVTRWARSHDGISKNSVKFTLHRSAKLGYILKRDTGIIKAYLYEPIFPVYEYLRIIDGREGVAPPHNARTVGRRNRYKKKKEVVKKSRAKKLTEDDVQQIRVLVRCGETSTSKIAEMFGISSHTVYQIKTGKLHRHVRDLP